MFEEYDIFITELSEDETVCDLWYDYLVLDGIGKIRSFSSDDWEKLIDCLNEKSENWLLFMMSTLIDVGEYQKKIFEILKQSKYENVSEYAVNSLLDY